MAALRNRFVIDGSCVLFLAAGDDNSVLPAMGKLRSKLGIDHELLDQNTYRFCWIVDYPLYELDEETRKYDFSHNPFSMPQGGTGSA